MMYGNVSPLTLKTRFIPSSEFNVDPFFQQTRIEQCNGQLNKGIFEVVRRSQTDKHSMYTSRFVDEIKEFGKARAWAKSLFVLCWHGYTLHVLITHVPTVQFRSCLIVLTVNSQHPNTTIAIRYIIQAFAQTGTRLRRPIYALRTSFVRLHKYFALLLLYPLYDIVESDVNWLFTYPAHHLNKLGLIASSYDFWFLYTKLYFCTFDPEAECSNWGSSPFNTNRRKMSRKEFSLCS